MSRFALAILLAVSVSEAAAEVKEFTIHVQDSVLADLKSRLERARLPDQIPGSGWDYGSDRAYMDELLEYWRTEYDWRKHEAALNALPHFKADIDGIDMHFVHLRSKEADAMPLVITHGWPGSVYEFMEVVGPLTDPVAHGREAGDAFHVVLPSMPGYGFSGPSHERGMSVDRVAAVVAGLMEELGYARYGAQGGDWGSGVSQWLARDNPDRLIGIHLNMVGGGPPEGMSDPEAGIPAWELKRHRERAAWWQGENAYGNIQGTKPLTLAYGLNDSPAGLAAWIVEKFRAWSDCDGDVESRFRTSCCTGSPKACRRQCVSTTSPDAAGAARAAWRSPRRLRSSLVRSSFLRASGSRPATTLSSGRRCRAAGTSPPWRSPSSTSTMSPSSFAGCGRSLRGGPLQAHSRASSASRA